MLAVPLRRTWLSLTFAGFLFYLAVPAESQEVATDSAASSSAHPPAPGVGEIYETYRLGFQGQIQQPEGLLVSRVGPHSPATQLFQAGDPNRNASLEFGDVILAVDGKRITSMADYRRAMDESVARGGLVELLVRDVGSGRESRWMAQGKRARTSGPPEAPRIRKVHFLLIGLTDDRSLGEAIGFNLRALQGMAEKEIAADRLGSVRTINGSQCRAGNILHEVQTLVTSSDDTIFCHYSGHGAYDPDQALPDDPSIGHHFQIPGGDLMRSELWKTLVGRGARLTVLMTDTCNVRAAVELGARREFQLAWGTRAYLPLEELLLGYRGLVDVCASDTNQYSWYGVSPENSGGWFTLELCRVLPAKNNWQSAFDELRNATNSSYQTRRAALLAGTGLRPDVRAAMEGQPEMTPRKFVFEVTRDDQSLSPRPLPEEEYRTQTYSGYVLPEAP
jgi:hypothetical protein